MEIYPVSNILDTEELEVPTLNALEADDNNYKMLLFQPKGEVEVEVDATSGNIRNRNQDLARSQFRAFLEEAATSQSDIVVTPEYSMPWHVLKEAINSRTGGPSEGKLWALGCESIKYSELQAMKQELAGVATLLFEQMEPDDTKFVDPLAYVFHAPMQQNKEETKVVILVQFKTHAMADKKNLEKSSLQLGQRVYQFGTYRVGISLITLICSDVFAFRDQEAQKVRAFAIVLHIQLNAEPRHQRFLETRARILGHKVDCDVIALNWAQDSRLFVSHCPTPSIFGGGSAWYLKSQDTNIVDDQLITENHRRGFYYAWHEPLYTHVFRFSSKQTLFFVDTSKVWSDVPAAVANRSNPRVLDIKTWNWVTGEWKPRFLLTDGFRRSTKNAGGASKHIRDSHKACPIGCERLIAICAGEACTTNNWFHLVRMGSFSLDQTENLNRMTVCESYSDRQAPSRIERLRKCASLWRSLQDTTKLPSALKDISNGFTLEWTPQAKHQNLRSNNDGRDRATVMHLGRSTREAAETAYNKAKSRIHKSMDSDENECAKAKQRILAWYINVDEATDSVYQTPQIDDQKNESPTDIGRES